MGRCILTPGAERNAGEASACDPPGGNCFLEELSFVTRTIPAYYVAGSGKMLRNIISLKEQLLTRVSFILDPASKFEDPGQMIEFAHHRGVCTGAEETDRCWGCVLYLPALQQWQRTEGQRTQPNRASPGGWRGWRGWPLQSQHGEFGAREFSMLHWYKSKA